MNTAKVGLAIGVLLILTGLLVPSATLIASLKTYPIDHPEQLLLGARLFKIGLVILGILAIALGRMSVWKSDSAGENFLADPHRKSHLFILAAILLAASALRLYGLDAGLWHDEIATYVNFAKMPAGEIISTYDSQNQNFLYSLLVSLCFRVFGDGAWSLRLPAAVFGVASIWALYLFGRWVGSAREALLAAGLLTFSYHHIWFSQNARGYTGLLFWTLLSSWLFLRALREGRSPLWLWYAVTAALGVYTQMTMVFVIAGHVVAYLTTLFSRRKEIWPERWAGLFLGFGFTGFFILLLHAFVLPQLLGTIVGQESTVPAWKNPIWTLLELVRGVRVGFAHSALAIVALAVFGVGLWTFARTNGAFILLLFVPPILCAAVTIGMGHHMWPRFFFFTVGFGALVVVRGAVLMGDWLSRVLSSTTLRVVPVGTAVGIGLILVSAASVPFAYAPKQDFRGALEFVQAQTEPGDAIVTVGLATFTYQNLYKMNWESAETLETLDAIRGRAKRTWLLYTFPTHMRSVHPEMMAVIRKDFQAVRQFSGTVGDGTVFVYRSDRPLT